MFCYIHSKNIMKETSVLFKAILQVKATPDEQNKPYTYISVKQKNVTI